MQALCQCGAGVAYPSGASDFSDNRVTRSLVFCVVFCGPLFVLFHFLVWSLHCLFESQLLVITLVSPIVSYTFLLEYHYYIATVSYCRST